MTSAFWVNYALALAVVIALVIIGIAIGVRLEKGLRSVMPRGRWNTTVVLSGCFLVAMFSLAFLMPAIRGAISTFGFLAFVAPLVSLPAAVTAAVARTILAFSGARA